MAGKNLKKWSFYGRSQELDDLAAIRRRGRWFFLKISGRRRIGKTTLVREALQPLQRERVLYIQIPDSDPAGVVSAAREFMITLGLGDRLPTSLGDLARLIGKLAEEGWIVALDEFQYFNRKSLFTFTSQLQAEVDRLAAKADRVPGGLIVLGSLHTEMAALLEDRHAPLYNRLTDDLNLGHLDIASILEILRTHADVSPERLLFLWNLFEGVPKFYRDCYERGVLGAERQTVLREMFFSSSSPLRAEADNWFLKELRGRYDLILKYIAAHPGCSQSEVVNHLRSVEPQSEKQVGGYLKQLDGRYRMIERLQPIFASPKGKLGRFYIRDNFLRSWLGALSVPVASIAFRPEALLIQRADERLRVSEGHGLEALVATLYEERSRQGLPGFELTKQIRGYWDRAGVEIDLVAVNEEASIIRLGTCKRSADKLVADLPHFDKHIEGFLEQMPRFERWKLERVALAPTLSPGHRAAISKAGYLAEDLIDLTRGL